MSHLRKATAPDAPDRIVPLTRFQKLALATVVTTLLLVAFGGYTRGSGSGFGCADRWPLCEGGALGGVVPRADFHMVVEWTHRWIAAIVGILAIATAVVAWRDHRHDRRVLWPAVGGVVLIGIQGYVGRVVVQRDLDADLVTLHLTLAMLITGLIVVGLVNSFFSGGRRPIERDGSDRVWSRWLAAGALGSLVLLLLGSTVHNRFVDGWPLVDGVLVPDFVSNVVTLHFAHRVVAGLGLVLLGYLAVAVVRRNRPRVEVALVYGAVACYLVNVGLGAAHVFTLVSSSGLVVAHLALASLVWTFLLAAAVIARRTNEAVSAPEPAPAPPDRVAVGV